MSDDNYNYLRQHRPDILRDCVEVGSAVTCADPGADRLTLGAKAEARAVSIAVKLLREQEEASPPAPSFSGWVAPRQYEEHKLTDFIPGIGRILVLRGHDHKPLVGERILIGGRAYTAIAFEKSTESDVTGVVVRQAKPDYRDILPVQKLRDPSGAFYYQDKDKDGG
ncbi:hypothetical protein UFOVP1382_27 [uncultured Caudovirales phage]|uniref:Uncharacterized protein n=1 Tax=uncultured Caudovirales phage TaxID=2100421 RepID=A0A6J5RXE1_9CAUD|nr:hypothetical protein UFOVP1382_27 [uncultured Caudovirales phage]